MTSISVEGMSSIEVGRFKAISLCTNQFDIQLSYAVENNQINEEGKPLQEECAKKKFMLNSREVRGQGREG